MPVDFSRATMIVALAMASTMMTIGCGGEGEGGANGGGGTAGSRGTAGTGGGGAIPIVVPQCVASAYQIVFRGLVEPLDPLLRYMDTAANQRDFDSQKPPIEGIEEDKDPVSPEVYYSRFIWDADDVQGVSDSGHTLITVDFVESTGLNPSNLDNGISNSEVVHVPWEMTVGTLPTVVGAGKMSVVGLGEDTIRMSILPLDDGGGNPWYEGWANYCRFEVFNFDLYLDLATPGSEPSSVMVGFTAVGVDFEIENGWFNFGESDTVVGFTGDFRLGGSQPIPFDLELDYGTDPAGITGTFAGVPASCTIDLDTFDVRC